MVERRLLDAGASGDFASGGAAVAFFAEQRGGGVEQAIENRLILIGRGDGGEVRRFCRVLPCASAGHGAACNWGVSWRGSRLQSAFQALAREAGGGDGGGFGRC